MCYWISYGAGVDEIWICRCVQPCCCWEQGWIVDGERRPLPDPDHGGALHPPRRPARSHAEGLTPAEKVWGRLGLQEMPTPASTEHFRMGGPEVNEDEPHSPIQPRNLFGADDEDAASDDTGSTDSGQSRSDAAPGAEIQISAEGYADDTYMLAIHLLSLLAMLVATSKWLKLTGQEVNGKKSLAFSATNKVRRKPEPLEATLDGVQMPVQQEFRQLGVGVRTMP